MKSNAGRLFWGIVLVLTGGYFLARDFGVAPDLSENGWAISLAVFSLAFFGLYVAGRFKDWGLLFPAFGAGAVAAVIWSAEAGYDGSELGTVILLGIALPFWVALLSDQKANWWAAIPGWALTVIAAIIFFEDSLDGNIIGSLVLFSIALPFLVVYFRNRIHWWALIPGYALSAIGLIVLFEDVLGGEVIGAFVLFSVALPFLIVYLQNRENWWALIPAGVLTIIGGTVLLEATNAEGEILGGTLTLGLALVFLGIYLRWREQWWAIIPAGILASSAATVFLSLIEFEQATIERLYAGVSLGGFALTFGALWILRIRHGTDWAKYPAAGLAGYALLAVILGPNVAWPIALILFGIWLLYRNMKEKQVA
jgi:hypothetical protein